MDGNLNKDLDENLPWLTQKTEDLKSNKGNLTSPPHTVNVIELNCKVINKVATPLPFLGNNVVPPQVTQFLEGPTSLLIRGGGWGFQLCMPIFSVIGHILTIT